MSIVVERLRLYDQGLNDREIARAQNVDRSTVRSWRRAHGLPSNVSAFPRAHEERLRLHREGLSDAEIARATGANRMTITGWRRYHGLPVNDLAAKLGPAGHARRMLYYQLGWSDVELGKVEGVPHSKILRWRRTLGLPANFARGQHQCFNPRPTMADVYRRIRRAVGAKIGRENVDDAVAEISLALLDGTIKLDEIETQARRYGNRVLEQFASKWGPRSLDKELTDDSGFTLLDTIADERSSSWLEEMGATVW